MSHSDFIKRYGRLGPRELSSSNVLGNPEIEAVSCAKLADSLLIRNRYDPDAKSKFEVGRTKIFIRLVFWWKCCKYLSFNSSSTVRVRSSARGQQVHVCASSVNEVFSFVCN